MKDIILGTPVPNLILIGAQKSGTTSLHSLLDTHPDVFMSAPVKEPTYFFPQQAMVNRLHSYNYKRAVDHTSLLNYYMLRGYKGEAIFGESSTSYTIGDASRRLNLPARIKEQSPESKLIYAMRNPFDRVMSAYRHSLGRHNIDIFKAETLKNDAQIESTLRTSLYYYQLSAYLDDFDLSRIHLVRFEDFTDDQDTVAADLFAFVGVSSRPPENKVRSNVSTVKGGAVQEKIPRPLLEYIYDPIVEDMKTFKRVTGFDTAQWDLSFETWCAE